MHNGGCKKEHIEDILCCTGSSSPGDNLQGALLWTCRTNERILELFVSWGVMLATNCHKLGWKKYHIEDIGVGTKLIKWEIFEE